jgi:hypothetical protein
MVRIFFDRIRDRIRLEGFRSVRIRVRILNIRYRIRIRILKSHIYDVDITIVSYPVWLTISVFEFESEQKYENKCNISHIRLYPICFHPYTYMTLKHICKIIVNFNLFKFESIM